MNDCIRRIVDASRGFDQNKEATLSERDAKKLLDELKSAAEKRAAKGEDYNDAIAAEVLAQKMEAKNQGAIQKRNALINITKDKEITARLDSLIAEGLKPHKAWQSFLVGVEGVYKAGKSSVDAKFKAIHGRYLGGFLQDLEKNDLLAISHQKALQPEIEKELWAIGEGKGGVTKSKEALQIAQFIHKYNESLRLRQNAAGAVIDKLENFTATQTHDRVAMRKQGYEKWRDTILPLLDKEKTFGDADAEDFLKSTYEVLTTGISRKTQQDEKLFQFSGPANLAKKISRKRVLHFKDAESSIQYRNEFGKRDFMEGVMRGIENASRNVTLLETFGTNPRAMFERQLTAMKEKYRDQPEMIKGLINDRTIRNFFDEIDGSTHIPESPTLSQIGSILRGVQSITKLGGSLISSFSDIPVKMAELRHQGFSIAERYGITLGDIRVNGTERKQLGALLGVGTDGMRGAIVSRFSATDDLPGGMAKLQRLFFKMNGLTWWTDAHKLGTGLAMSHRLAQFKDLSFNALDKDTQRLFRNYDISEADWENIRRSATKQLDGKDYITPDAVRDIGLSEKDANILEDKLRTYFIDRVDSAVISPGARENVYSSFGYAGGTVAGEFFRTMMQFKSFPITFVSKVVGRGLYAKGKADVPALVQTAVMMTLMGYVSMSGKDLLKGRQPRPVDDVNTWKAAFLQGGGAGIMGDFLLGEYNRFGQDFTTTAMGPTFSTLNDIAKLYAAARNGDDTAAKALNLTINNMPFANLFYLRPALNYMFIYQLQEAVNPGYLRRMERRVEKENNQKFLIKPSSVK